MRRRAPRGCRGHRSRQAPDDGRRLRRTPPGRHSPRQPVGRLPLDRNLVERVGRRDGGRHVLCVFGDRYRRLDPFSVGVLRVGGNQADLWPGLAPGSRGSRGISRPRRSDGAQRSGCGPCARHHRGRRPARPDDAARPRPGLHREPGSRLARRSHRNRRGVLQEGAGFGHGGCRPGRRVGAVRSRR